MMQLCASKARLRSSSSPFFFPVQGTAGYRYLGSFFGRFVAMPRRGAKISSSFLWPITPLNAA